MITRQMTKQMKQIQPQVSLVLESILDNVVQKNQKRVTWLPAGIKSLLEGNSSFSLVITL